MDSVVNVLHLNSSLCIPKDVNKGTGLGLTICLGIIKDHHGKLTFETEEGQYTKFYLDLPVYNDNLQS